MSILFKNFKLLQLGLGKYPPAVIWAKWNKVKGKAGKGKAVKGKAKKENQGKEKEGKE